MKKNSTAEIFDGLVCIGDSDDPFSSSLQRGIITKEILALAGDKITCSLLAPVEYLDYSAGNAWIAAVAALYPDKFVPFAGIDINNIEAYEILRDAIEKLHLKGLRIVIKDNAFFSNQQLCEIFRYCEKHSLPVILIADSFHDEIIKLVSDHKNIRFMISALSEFTPQACYSLINSVKNLNNLWITSCSINILHYFKTASQLAGRFVFASNSPRHSPSIELARVIELGLDKALYEKILSQNVLEFIGMNSIPEPRLLKNKFNKNDLLEDLQRMGISPGDQLLVHSSLSSIGHVEDGPRAVVDALIGAVSPGGTILFPVFTFDINFGDYLREINGHVINLQNCLSKTGAITMAAQEYPNALQSLHPTHPVVGIGPDSAELLSTHHLCESGPVGKLSPFYKLTRKQNGKIILIGCRTITSLHMVEELYTHELSYDDVLYSIKTIGRDGRCSYVKVRPYRKIHRNFGVVDSLFLKHNCMKLGFFGNAECRVINAPGMLEVLTRKLADDRYFLLHPPSEGPAFGRISAKTINIASM